jgi:hypothetical protein
MQSATLARTAGSDWPVPPKKPATAASCTKASPPAPEFKQTPIYLGSTPPGSPTGSSSDDTAVKAAIGAAVAVVLLAVFAIAALCLWRRRRRQRRKHRTKGAGAHKADGSPRQPASAGDAGRRRGAPGSHHEFGPVETAPPQLVAISVPRGPHDLAGKAPNSAGEGGGTLRSNSVASAQHGSAHLGPMRSLSALEVTSHGSSVQRGAHAASAYIAQGHAVLPQS